MDYYFVVVRMSRGKRFDLRLQLVTCARREGIREAARLFRTTRNTVRKWLRRYAEGGVKALVGRSRAPKHIPHKTPNEVARYVCSLRRQFKGWGVDRLAKHFDLRCSTSAAHRIVSEAGLTRRGPKKKRSRNDLRAQKARLRPFEKIQIDTKELRDIPRYAKWMRAGNLPRYQYSARDVRTGAAYLAYSQTNDSVKAAAFAGYLLHHLTESGVNLRGTTVQTDNGTEYVGGGRKKSAQPSLFEHIVEHFTGRQVVRIFPGACRSQSDVESYHRLVEEELYEVEDLRTETELLGKAYTYQLYFNHLRKNLYKGGVSPKDILLEADKHANPNCLTLPPIRLESLPLHLLPQVGHHVPGLVKGISPRCCRVATGVLQFRGPGTLWEGLHPLGDRTVTESECSHTRDTARMREDGPRYGEDGVDVTLIRWMLSLTPEERIRVLEDNIYSLARLRNGKLET